jgi:hypothetical protein
MKDGKKVLLCQPVELIVTDSAVITEGDDSFLTLKGVFAEADTINGNRRVYPKEIMEREVKRFQAKINQGKSFGKAYHPGFWDSGTGGTTGVAMRILSLEMEGNTVNGTLKLLNTTDGRNITAMIDDKKGKVGISSRGYGSTKREDWKNPVTGRTHKNVSIIQDDYELETYDIVLNPSVSKAMLKISEELTSLGMKAEEGVLEDDSSFEFNVKEGMAKIHVGVRAINETVNPVSAEYPSGDTFRYDSASSEWYKVKEMVSDEKVKQEDIKIMDRKKLLAEFPDTYGAIKREGFEEGVTSLKESITAKDAEIFTLNKDFGVAKEKLAKVEGDLVEAKKTLDVTNEKYKELDKKLKLSEEDTAKGLVKTFIDKKAAESKYTKFIKPEDLELMYSCEGVEAAGKSFDKFEAFLIRVTKNVSEALSTSNNGNGLVPVPGKLPLDGDAKKQQEEIDSQRELAGLDD